MGSPEFRFKQFIVRQELSAMKVGTDGVLLGAWCSIDHGMSSILDIGTGTGLISLMVAQRSAETTKIDAIEIDADSSVQAARNFTASLWSERLNIINRSIQEYACETAKLKRYDLIVTNPPYFNDSLLPPSASRTLARHTAALSPGDLLDAAGILMSDKGILSLIFPFENADRFVESAHNRGLYLRRRTDVCPKPVSRPRRSLMEFHRADGEVDHDTLVIETTGRHIYSQEYVCLTRDFYIKF